MTRHEEILKLAERIMTLVGLVGEIQVKAKAFEIKLNDLSIIIKPNS